MSINNHSTTETPLKKETLRSKREKFKETLEKALRNMDISVEEWVKTIRKSRRERY